MAETESSVPVQRLLVGLITDISTATKISAKPTSELHMIVSPQNSAENVTANRLPYT